MIKGKRVWKLALASFTENKKSAIKVSVSIALSLILIILTYTIYTGIDIDKYLGKFIDSDYIIGSTQYFQSEYTNVSQAIPEDYLNMIQIDGIEDAGSLYYYLNREKCMIDLEKKDYNLKSGLYDNNGRAYLDLYGVDDFVLNRMEIYDGKIDINQLKSGKYILYGLTIDDEGNVTNKGDDYSVGEEVRLYINGIERIFTIMAKIKITQTNSVRYWSKLYSMYLPTNIYKKITGSKDMMAYMFNVKDSYENSINASLTNYVDNINNTMAYTSRASYVEEFNDMQYMVIIVGCVSCIIIGMIGLFNYINIIITKIITKKYELAVMQGIGMTNLQMTAMLSIEGICFALTSIIITLIAGSVISLTILRVIIKNLWFCTYCFTLQPIFFIIPILLIITALIPFITFCVINKTSIISRMKKKF